MIGELIPTGFTYDQGRVEINDSFSGTANLNNLLLDADFSGGTGGGVIYSAGTDLYNIFLTSAGANDITRVQPGSNTTTGGTGNFPIVNVVPSPSFNSVTASGASSFTTLSATTMISGSTDLYNIFLTSAGANDITRVQPGLNTYTGGTGNNPTVNISGGTLNNLNITGGTLSSGGTNLYSIFLTTADGNDITRVQPGSNITTGGTGNLPTINLTNNIHINNINFSGTGLGNTFSATTVSGGTIYSGSTNLYDIFCTDCGGGSGFSGFTSSTGAFSIVENNGSGNIASESYGVAGGKQVNSTLYGQWARSSGGDFGQYGFLSWYGSTTLSPLNVSQLYLDGGSLSKLFVIPLNTSYYVDFKITAKVDGGLLDGDSATWTTDGMVKNIGGVVSVPVDTGGNQFAMNAKVLDGSFLPPGPTVVISAETATSALTVTVIGPDDNALWFVRADFTRVG